MRIFTLLSIGVASLLAACSPFSPDLGNTPFGCTVDDMKCPSGYVCTDDGTSRLVCVAEGSMIVDAPVTGFQCANDSNIEGTGGNDTITNAFNSQVNGSTRKTIEFADLAICPEGDKDNYLLQTATANQNIEVIVSWDSGMPMSVSILGSGGQTLATGMATSDPRAVRAYIANAPVGSYYALVTAGPTTKNNYRLAITITP